MVENNGGNEERLWEEIEGKGEGARWRPNGSLRARTNGGWEREWPERQKGRMDESSRRRIRKRKRRWRYKGKETEWDRHNLRETVRKILYNEKWKGGRKIRAGQVRQKKTLKKQEEEQDGNYSLVSIERKTDRQTYTEGKRKMTEVKQNYRE